MYESMLNFPASLFGDFDRLRRELDNAFAAGMPASIRSVAPGTYPAINIGSTRGSVEIYAFAPGIDPQKVDVTIDRGVLTITGERAPTAPEKPDVGVYSRERPSGSFKRAVSLPDDADPTRVEATYRDGILRVSVARREAAQPKRITIQ